VFKDPLYNFCSYLNFNWYSFAIFYALLSNFVDFVFLNVFNGIKYGGPERYKKYLKNKLNWLFWPVFIMGGVSSAYIITGQFSTEISKNISNYGISYQSLDISHIYKDYAFVVCLIISLGISGYTLWRHVKETTLFFTKPLLFIIIRTILFDLPLSYMVCTSILRVVDQVVVLHRFYSSGWLPISYLTADSFYGLRWAHSLLIKQIALGLIISFVPLIMLSRKEMATKHAKEYIASPILFLVAISIPLLILSRDLNEMLTNINEHFMGLVINNIQLIQNNYNTNNMIGLIVLYQELDQLSKLPNQINLPILLEGSLGASALFWVGYITDKVFDNLWESIPQKLNSFLLKDRGNKNNS